MPKLLLTPLLLLAACASAPEPATENSRPAPVAAVRSEEIPADETLASPASFTVLSAVAYAVEANPDLRIAFLRIAAAEEEVKVASSAWWPTLGVGFDLTYSDDPANVLMMTLRQRSLELGPTTDLNDPGAHSNSRVSVTAGWQLYDGGRRSNATEMRRLSVLLAESDRDAVMNSLRAAVIDTSLAVHMAEEFVHVANESVRLTEEQVRLAKARHELGQAQRSDLLSAEVRLAEAKENRVKARNAKSRALTALRNLMGLPSAAPLTLLGSGAFTVTPVTEENLEAVALANRPEIRKAGDAVLMAEEDVSMQRSGHHPTVSLFGSYDWDTEVRTDLDFEDSGTVGLSLDWALFEGGRTKARVAAAKSRLEEAREQERKARLAVTSDVSMATLRLAEAKERLDVSETSIAQAEEALRLISARYENGAATITEYLDAEVALTGARVRHVSARYDVERATADLRRALGICRTGAITADPEKTGGER
ncbi:MAG: TolC family protein [Planctomycetota bacterium]